ncbi:hypothetical protein ZWY2020_033826 [Hordeum vulgare]|nr:hypothetical protein ZWY2020_033826 [Hordeum vulgare]
MLDVVVRSPLLSPPPAVVLLGYPQPEVVMGASVAPLPDLLLPRDPSSSRGSLHLSSSLGSEVSLASGASVAAESQRPDAMDVFMPARDLEERRIARLAHADTGKFVAIADKAIKRRSLEDALIGCSPRLQAKALMTSGGYTASFHLDLFAAATSLVINFSKSTLVPMHVDPEVLSAVMASFGSYLGLPLSFSNLKLYDFAPMFAKVDKYLAGWCARLLSPAGRLVLINVMLDSLPTYATVAMRLPPAVMAKLDSLRRAFL